MDLRVQQWDLMGGRVDIRELLKERIQIRRPAFLQLAKQMSNFLTVHDIQFFCDFNQRFRHL